MKPIASARRTRKNRPTAKPPVYGLCPICEKAYLRRQLRATVAAEKAVSRRQIQRAILEQHPAWSPSAGACRGCWESYRGIVRVMQFMQRFQARNGGSATRRA